MIRHEGDRIITAWAEQHSGPGWAGRCVSVLVFNPALSYRIEVVRFEELNTELGTLFPFSVLAGVQMTEAIKRYLAEQENVNAATIPQDQKGDRLPNPR